MNPLARTRSKPCDPCEVQLCMLAVSIPSVSVLNTGIQISTTTMSSWDSCLERNMRFDVNDTGKVVQTNSNNRLL